jgi:phage anti-repressor protein
MNEFNLTLDQFKSIGLITCECCKENFNDSIYKEHQALIKDNTKLLSIIQNNKFLRDIMRYMIKMNYKKPQSEIDNIVD